MTNITESVGQIKLLYIAGTGRNGSTLLERILTEIPGVFAAGELGRVTRYNKNKTCLCGEKLTVCPIWQAINNEIDSQIDEERFTQLDLKYSNLKGLNLLKLLTHQKELKLSGDFQQYLNMLAIKYKAIHKHKSGQIITDSTIDSLYGYYLSLIPSIDLYILHLIRDPRGVSYSWQRLKFSSSTAKKSWTPQISPLKTALSWVKRNIFIEFMFARTEKYLQVSYEDLVENPSAVVKKIANLLNLKLEPLDFIKGQKITLGESHLIGGNLDAFKKGGEEIILKPDERWKHQMKWVDIILVNLITWPLMLKYSLSQKRQKNRLSTHSKPSK
ncbi:hypothetical protein THII_2154 [Thioploca ingrica]|uniref:Uncharacterized protein n=1 Tax=Thioploca ingrica TaxID=40754 RepID=A0A090BV92_9GAMM|nr:hypothetical protein THII_2154 [Thioploca ingrica]